MAKQIRFPAASFLKRTEEGRAVMLKIAKAYNDKNPTMGVEASLEVIEPLMDGATAVIEKQPDGKITLISIELKRKDRHGCSGV